MRQDTTGGNRVFITCIIILAGAFMIGLVLFAANIDVEYMKTVIPWDQKCRDKGGVPFSSSHGRICFAKNVVIEIETK